MNPKSEDYWRKRASRIKEMLEKENPDIILVQELTYPMTSCIPDCYKKATGCSISHHVYCRKEYQVKDHEWHMRWCRAKICTGDRLVNVFSVHTHWDKDIYTDTCFEITQKLITYWSGLFGGKNITNIAGGDWNNEPSAIENHVFPMDIIRTHAPTFCNWKTGKAAELDYFAVWPKAGKISVVECPGSRYSDHKALMLDI